MRNKRQRGPGFRQMRVANIHKESNSVTSFILSPIDGQPLPLFQAGQFVVLRLLVDPGKPPVLRSYSLSDLPAADHFRISVKNEFNRIGSSFLCNRAREGDLLDVSAPRRSFTLRPSQAPVVPLSAGVGATPVMAMLHTLAAERSQREIWWIYGAHHRVDHPFAEESCSLLKQLSRGRGYIVYSRPAAIDQLGANFDAPGHIDTPLRERIGVSQGSDFYLCGPSSSLQNMRDELRIWGVAAGNVHTEIFGSLESITPGMARVGHPPHQPQGPPGSGPQFHSRVAGLPPLGIVIVSGNVSVGRQGTCFGLVPELLRASAVGWYSAVVGLLGLVASVVAGLLWDRVSHAAVFYYGAIFAIAGSVGLFFIPGKHNRSAVDA